MAPSAQAGDPAPESRFQFLRVGYKLLRHPRLLIMRTSRERWAQWPPEERVTTEEPVHRYAYDGCTTRSTPRSGARVQLRQGCSVQQRHTSATCGPPAAATVRTTPACSATWSNSQSIVLIVGLALIWPYAFKWGVAAGCRRRPRWPRRAPRAELALTSQNRRQGKEGGSRPWQDLPALRALLPTSTRRAVNPGWRVVCILGVRTASR